MRKFDIEGESVIMLSASEQQSAQFVSTLGEPKQWGFDGLILLSIPRSTKLEAEFRRHKFQRKYISDKNLSPGQFDIEAFAFNVTFVVPYSEAGILLALKAASRDFCYASIDSDIELFNNTVTKTKHPIKRSWLGDRLRQILESFPSAEDGDTDKFSFSEAIKLFIKCAEGATADDKLEWGLGTRLAPLNWEPASK